MTELGLHLPNREFVTDDWPRIRALGVSSYVDLHHFRWRWPVLLYHQPDARIHARVDWRGPLGDPESEASDLTRMILDYPGVSTWRARNEVQLESPGVTPQQWRDYLIAFGKALSIYNRTRVAVPAVSPGTPDWLAWLDASAEGMARGGFGLMDIHAYGDPGEVEAVLAEYNRRRQGCRLICKEHNFGAGRNYDLARYAADLPRVIEVCAKYRVEACIVFVWEWANPDTPLPTTVNVRDTIVEAAIASMKKEVSVSNYPEAQQKYSPNYGYPTRTAGRQGHLPVAIVDHITAGSAAATDSVMMSPTSERSAQYLVREDGSIICYIEDDNASWGCGIDFARGYGAYQSDLSVPWLADAWRDQVTPNLIVINIEHEAMPGELLTPAQLAASVKLHKWLFEKYGWPLEDFSRIEGHSAIDAVTRSQDPGAGVLAQIRGGLSVQPAPATSAIGEHLDVLWGEKNIIRSLGTALESGRLKAVADVLEERIVAIKRDAGLG